MNAAIRAITKVAASHDVPTWGVEQGFDGLIDGVFRPLSRRNKMGDPAPVHEVESEGGQGGTILGSSRSPRFFDRTARVEAARQLEEYSITGVVGIEATGRSRDCMPFNQRPKSPSRRYPRPSTTT
jgi:6-phosphofructokinase 1